LVFSFNRLRVQIQAETLLFRFDARKVQSEAEWREVSLELKDFFGLQLEEFLAGVATGRLTKPDWQDALTNLQLIRAAYQSVAEGREVRVAEATQEVTRV